MRPDSARAPGRGPISDATKPTAKAAATKRIILVRISPEMVSGEEAFDARLNARLHLRFREELTDERRQIDVDGNLPVLNQHEPFHGHVHKSCAGVKGEIQ